MHELWQAMIHMVTLDPLSFSVGAALAVSVTAALLIMFDD